MGHLIAMKWLNMAAEIHLWQNIKTQRTSESQKQQHIMMSQQYKHVVTAQLDKML